MNTYRRELTEEEKEKIVNDSLPYIKYTAYRLSRRLPPQLSVNDLISAGIVGLLDALKRYEEGRVKLSTFVEHRIRGAMLDEIRSQDWVPRSTKKKIDEMRKAHQRLEAELGRPPDETEIAESLHITLEEYRGILHDSHNAVCLSLEDLCERGEEKGQDMRERISDPNAESPLSLLEDKNLKEVLSQAIMDLPERDRLVLSLYYWDELTMKEIGRVMGVTEGRVCQIHTQALLRLRAAMEELVAH